MPYISGMTPISEKWLVLGALVLGTPLYGLPANNPYESIVSRNSFGLKPPPPVVTNTAAPEAPPNIEFTGVTTIGDEKKGWFVILPKPPETTPQYVSLRLGERSGPLELKEIFEDKGEARIVTNGKESTIAFKKTPVLPVKTAGGAQPAPGNTGIVPPGGVAHPAGAAAANSVVASPQASVVATAQPSVVAGSTATRAGAAGIQPPAATAPAAAMNVAGVSGAGATALRSIPTRTLRLSPGQGESTTAAAAGGETSTFKTREEAIVNLELQREMTKEAVAQKKMPPLPPTPMTPKE